MNQIVWLYNLLSFNGVISKKQCITHLKSVQWLITSAFALSQTSKQDNKHSHYIPFLTNFYLLWRCPLFWLLISISELFLGFVEMLYTYTYMRTYRHIHILIQKVLGLHISTVHCSYSSVLSPPTKVSFTSSFADGCLRGPQSYDKNLAPRGHPCPNLIETSVFFLIAHYWKWLALLLSVWVKSSCPTASPIQNVFLWAIVEKGLWVDLIFLSFWISMMTNKFKLIFPHGSNHLYIFCLL